VAEVLQQARLGTLLFDLLTEQEEAIDIMTAELRFNIDLLADRLIGATDWAIAGDDTRGLKIGYFGASTGAAAALIAAAARPRTTYAVVSRGGRPDLAGRVLNRLTAPTLLIVGGEDPQVIKLNEQALEKLPATTEKELRIIPGATHLFEEPGTLEEVSRLATDWFTHYL
jgi:dienelactone hydrolase